MRWDIIEEHLDESGFLYGQWEAALRSPLFTIGEVAEGPQERLLAHIDGLVLAGEAAVKKLLIPELAGDDIGRIFAAVFALLEGGRTEDFDEVMKAFGSAEPLQRAAMCRALSVAPRENIGLQLASVLGKAPADRVWELVEVLAYRQVDSQYWLDALVVANAPANELRALRVAKHYPELIDQTAVNLAYSSKDSFIRGAALELGYVAGLFGALNNCEITVAQRGPGFGTAALILAFSGSDKAVEYLSAALGDEKVCKEAAFSLGFSGKISAAEALLGLMKNEKLAPIAAEGFSAITGLVIEKEFAKPGEKWDPKAEEETSGADGVEIEDEKEIEPEADLPKPVVEEIENWWNGARKRFEADERYLRGEFWSLEGVQRELVNGPARRREALAIDLVGKSRGKIRVSWDEMVI